MIPIENSIAGRVADIHHLLPASGLHIVGETFPADPFSAAGHSRRRARGDFAACTAMSMRSANAARSSASYGLKPVVAGDTAGSAREVAEAGDPDARLARDAAGRRDLRPRRRSRRTSRTRRTTRRASWCSPKTPRWAPADNGPVVTTFVFRVRNVPAALYKALGGFATNGVNMTKLESYMVEGEFSATQFLADVDGHPDDPALRARAGGTRLLLARGAHPRRLSRPSLPAGDVRGRRARIGRP